MIGHAIYRNTQLLFNNLLRSKYHCNAILILRSVPNRNLKSPRRAYHNHINNIVTSGVPLLSRSLPIVLVRNKWNNSLIQQSPKTHVLNYGVVERYYTTKRTQQSGRNRSTLIYTTATAIVVLGLSYAAVPLYRMFCQVCCTCLPIYRIQCNSSSNRSPYRIQCSSSCNRSPYRIQYNSSSNRSPYRIQ